MDFSLILNSEIIYLSIHSATSYDPKVLDLIVFFRLLKVMIRPLQTSNSIPLCDILVKKIEAWSDSTKVDVSTG